MSASNVRSLDMEGQVSPGASKEEDAVVDHQIARSEQQERLARRSAEEYEAKRKAASGRSSGTASSSAISTSVPSGTDAVASRPARPPDAKSRPAGAAAATPGVVAVTSPPSATGSGERNGANSAADVAVDESARSEQQESLSRRSAEEYEAKRKAASNKPKPRSSDSKSRSGAAAATPGVVAMPSPSSAAGSTELTPTDSAARREERKARRGPSDDESRPGTAAVAPGVQSAMIEPDEEDGNLPEEGPYAVVGSTVDTNRSKPTEEIAVAQRDSLRNVIWSYRCPICLVMCPLITGIALAIVFLRSQVIVIPEPTASPTVSMAPTNSRIFDVESALQAYGPPFDNDTAYDWLVYNDTWAPFNVSEGVEESSLWLERYAVVSFYFAAGGQTWWVNQGWLNTTESICSWYGVGCESNGLVVEFVINHPNNLIGSLPYQVFNELKGMTLFQFWGNPLLAGSVPTEIGLVSGLQALWLDRNGLTGTIPTEVGLLTALNTFMLYENNLQGTIPTEIGNFTKMQYFSVATNRNIEGPIPTEIGLFTSLVGFWCERNRLSGTIPTEVGAFQGAQFLVLADNNLSGTIPSEIGSLHFLGDLQLAENKLEGTIPSELQAVAGLSTFTLDDNALTGGIPLFVETLWSVGTLGLGKNPLGGTIPAGIFELAQLSELRMSWGNFTGSLPSTVPLKNLEILLLSNNLLTGAVPEFVTPFLDFHCFMGANNFTEVQNGIDANCILAFR